jgi:sulfur-oxidizing protein SoxZ
MARTLIVVPTPARRGEVIELRATIGHAMETGYRVDSDGQRLPRDILTRFECRLDGELVFAADLYPAIAANPYIAFKLRAQKGGTLNFLWLGDRGFQQAQDVALVVAA